MADSMDQSQATRRWLAALLVGCNSLDLIKFVDFGPGQDVVAIGPDGKKYRFTSEQLEAKKAKTVAEFYEAGEKAKEQAAKAAVASAPVGVKTPSRARSAKQGEGPGASKKQTGAKPVPAKKSVPRTAASRKTKK